MVLERSLGGSYLICWLRRNLTKFFDFKPQHSRNSTSWHNEQYHFWKCVTRPFRWIYVNCFDRLNFLADISIKLQKMHLFRQFQGHKSEGNMETKQMTPFFSSTFFALTVFNFISEFENTQNSFSCGQFWSAKNLWIWAAHHTFLESRHPEVSKN